MPPDHVCSVYRYSSSMIGNKIHGNGHRNIDISTCKTGMYWMIMAKSADDHIDHATNGMIDE